VLRGRDVLGLAQTGTGKTASFTLPMIDILGQGRAKARMPRSLILAPTRELAAQVAESFTTYGKYHSMTMALLIGGVSFGDQERLLDRGVDVLIATPGRLIDHFERGKLMLHGVQILVIDEADRMLDMGFIPDVERICSLMPMRRQTLFFSATMLPEIKKLVDRFLNDPVQITVAALSSPAETVAQNLVLVAREEKRDALRRLVRAEQVGNGIVFCNTKRQVAILHRSLERHGFSVAALHGDLEQHVRTQVLDGFRKGTVQLLVASDVAARGLDIPEVTHVFNFDVPTHPEDYVHRIGRTGRAGRSGRAITLATPAELRAVAAIERLIQREIPRLEVEGLPAPEAEEAEESGGRRRRSRKTAEATTPRTGRQRRRPAEPPEGAAESVAAEASAEVTEAEPAEAEVTEVEATEAKPVPRPVPADRPKPARPHQEAVRKDQKEPRRRERRREPADAPVLGFGDATPAFLLRSVWPRHDEAESGEDEDLLPEPAHSSAD
jgi:superfamily II DNA/RNA helicase